MKLMARYVVERAFPTGSASRSPPVLQMCALKGENPEFLFTDGELRRLQMRVLLLWGEEDSNAGRSEAVAFAARLPNAILEAHRQGHALLTQIVRENRHLANLQPGVMGLACGARGDRDAAQRGRDAQDEDVAVGFFAESVLWAELRIALAQRGDHARANALTDEALSAPSLLTALLRKSVTVERCPTPH